VAPRRGDRGGPTPLPVECGLDRYSLLRQWAIVGEDMTNPVFFPYDLDGGFLAIPAKSILVGGLAFAQRVES